MTPKLWIKVLMPVAFLALIPGYLFLRGPGKSMFRGSDVGVERTERSYQERAATRFLKAPADPYRSPEVTAIPIPDFAGSAAIWGAIGRDDGGHVWFGVSAEGAEFSAHLFEYDPESGVVTDRGGALQNLRNAGIYRTGERQVKIHSKIIPADDGYLYFSSMDEQGEDQRAEINPVWGSHLWRLRPGDEHWEHLLAAPEGLIAVAGQGRWIYALGYWNHILYQYDTLTGRIQQKEIGSVGGHISRNFVVDHRGHAFVPRLWTGEDGETLVVAILELNTFLENVSMTLLDHYARSDRPAGSHGITGFTYLADKSIIFATHEGFLYQIVPTSQGPAAVNKLGWFHPSGRSYAPSIFPLAGTRYLVGQARPTGSPRDWVIYDIETGTSRTVDFPFDQPALLYGTNTRDDQGDFYIAGRVQRGQASGRYAPLLLRVHVGE